MRQGAHVLTDRRTDAVPDSNTMSLSVVSYRTKLAILGQTMSIMDTHSYYTPPP